MSVRRELWGTTHAGEPVELFTLEREWLRARVATFGATLVALEMLQSGGRPTQLVLGLDSLRAYESPSNPYLGGVIGRCANRIANARFSLDGREHVLSANEGCHHLHGGHLGFDRRVWRVTAASGVAVELAYASRDGEEGYPGTVEVLASYTLGANELLLRLAATASEATPLNLTQHSYFNLAGGGTILDHDLEIRASRYVAVDEELIPTGELAAVADSAYDFRSARCVGARLAELKGLRARGYDVCYALDRDAGDFAARLRDPASGRTLELGTNQPGLQLYTGQNLRALASAVSTAPLVIPGNSEIELVRVPRERRLVLVSFTMDTVGIHAVSSSGDVLLSNTLPTYPYSLSHPVAGLTGVVVEPDSRLLLRNQSSSSVAVTGRLLGYFAPL